MHIIALMERDFEGARHWLETSTRGLLNDAGLGGMASSIDGLQFSRGRGSRD